MTKTAFVTGANKGIGLEIARQLGQGGWKVVLGARNAERGTEAAAELSEQGIDAEFLQLDLSDSASIDRAIADIRSGYPELSLLINNAGIPGAFVPSFNGAAEEHLRAAFEVNFFGTFRLNQSLLPLIGQNEGTIVNVSTDMASLNYMQTSDYALNVFTYNASKTANNAMTVAMSIELKNSRAQVFAVTPGFTKTDLNGNAEGGQTKKAGAKIIVDYATDGKRHNGEFLNAEGIFAW
ncbi:SDR family NAD(P)-dependent oxidoreductase [Saccharibacillus sp. CPCC 101409]|uniref:SDR family NAD(P)-dependent oxidoreductase n=1 Tax=Saccharibacillus sp. CPCC 101409 TaxID=3058041 RepID=UPI0026710A6E|nr:SDR family NAD(P)-dependent oxidoreductase [Saccharibacillus sp. CPCC 101409]MDO3412825.1 SDR family NAD(P)-dependent oxidoreductase [Saccharibacillus sp. CPCC 101409]